MKTVAARTPTGSDTFSETAPMPTLHETAIAPRTERNSPRTARGPTLSWTRGRIDTWGDQ